MWAIIITDLFGNEHSYGRLFNSREDARAIKRFLKAEHARGCLFGTGFTAKEVAAVSFRGGSVGGAG